LVALNTVGLAQKAAQGLVPPDEGGAVVVVVVVVEAVEADEIGPTAMKVQRP
jgi:hypothetical protein